MARRKRTRRLTGEQKVEKFFKFFSVGEKLKRAKKRQAGRKQKVKLDKLLREERRLRNIAIVDRREKLRSAAVFVKRKLSRKKPLFGKGTITTGKQFAEQLLKKRKF